MSDDIHVERMSLADALDLAGRIADPEEGAVEELMESGPEVIDVLRCEVLRLHAIIEGRTTPPTEEEIEAHAKAGGSWLALRCGAAMWWSIEVTRFRDMAASLGLTATWIALDADARPCPWPVVGGAR